MPVYIAMLRGVNVGNNSLKMERLREVCMDLGFRSVRTYVQSGNVVFEATGVPSRWCGKFERALAAEVRLPVSIIVRTPAEMRIIVSRNPFLKRRGIDTTKLHVTFLMQEPSKTARSALTGISAGDDEFHLSGENIYIHCPNGYGRTKLSNNAHEKTLGVRATTRNWNTVNRLYAMAAE
ncbi:MAG TPA: DUF1697 domain-containing protein [Xanthobacteraceae bacterium]|jgi:uncharacterized protein (DUF1697 family)